MNTAPLSYVSKFDYYAVRDSLGQEASRSGLNTDIIKSIHEVFKEIEDVHYLNAVRTDATRLRASLFHLKGMRLLLDLKAMDCPEQILSRTSDLFIDHFLKLTVASVNTATTANQQLKNFTALVSIQAGMNGIEELLQLRPSVEAALAMAAIDQDLRKLFIVVHPVAQQEIANRGKQ